MYSPILMILLAMVSANLTAESVIEQNAQIIKPYRKARIISELDWGLLQVNMGWPTKYLSREEQYLEGYQAGFDPRLKRFHTLINVFERRFDGDTATFVSLPKSRQEAILQVAIDRFVALLGIYFPEVKNNHNLIYIEFVRMRLSTKAGKGMHVAKYENGLLTMME